MRLEDLERSSIETCDVDEHPPERRPERVAALREDPAREPSRPHDAAALVRHREAHLRRHGLDLELVEQSCESGVVRLVEDDEARVHFVGLVTEIDADRVGVPARSIGGLEDRDVVHLGEGPRGSEA